METLDEISKRYNLDKNAASGFHDYIPAYDSLFRNIRMTAKTVVEIGIGVVEAGQMGGAVGQGYKTGNSLRCWRDYFPEATIYGLDIYPVNLVEPRIRCLKVDQGSVTDLSYFLNVVRDNLDVVIDDGSHLSWHQLFGFLSLHPYLKIGGFYCIEDIQPDCASSFLDLSIFPLEIRNLLTKQYKIYVSDTRQRRNRKDDLLMAFQRVV